MEISRWKFEFELTPSLVGVGVFGAFAIAGFVVFESRMVFFPVAFLAGVVTGLLSRTHSMLAVVGISGVYPVRPAFP